MMYYDIRDDINKYPDAWCYIIIGGRFRGKTYSTLWDCVQNQRDFIFIKRAMEDVDMMAAGTGTLTKTGTDSGVDFNPFKAVNRDKGTNIKAFGIKSGIAGFWESVSDEEGKMSPVGSPLGMAFALNGITKYKGFELASAKQEQWIIFDEFIPNIYDRVNRKEGIQLLDFYETVSRDRVLRGLDEIKLICLANATSINNPVMDTLEIVDLVAEMQSMDQECYYAADRGIFIHQVPDDPERLGRISNTGIYKAMGNTAWGQVSYGNKFAYNDFSNVSKQALKHFRCVTGYHYKEKTVYIYYNEGVYYLTESKGQPGRIYDLNRENEQKAFFYDWVADLREHCINDRVRFKQYTMYDLIINYKKIFKII